MHDEHDPVRDRRALLKNGLVMAGAFALPGAVSATPRLAPLLKARDLRPMSQPPLPSVPAAPRLK